MSRASEGPAWSAARPVVAPGVLLAVAVASQVGISLCQQGTGVLAVFLRERDHLSLTAMGGLVSASTLGMMVGNMPGGRVLDRVGTRPVVAICALVAAALWAGLSLHLPATYLPLFAVFAAQGVVYGPAGIGGARAVFHAFPAEKRGLAMGIRQTGVPAGSALAAALLPLLVERSGLRPTFAVLAAVLLVLPMILAWAAGPGRTRGHPESATAEGEGGQPAAAGTGLGAGGSRGAAPRGTAAAGRSEVVATLRAVARPCVVGALLSAGQYDVLTYTIVNLHATVAMTFSLAGLVLAASQLGGAAGRVVFGWLSDRGTWGRARYTALVGVVGVATFGSLATWGQHLPLWGLFPLFLAVGVAAAGWNALIIVWAAEASGPEAAGLAMGASATSVFVGASIFAPLFGAIVAATGSYGPGWAMVATSCGLAALLAAGGSGRSPVKADPA